MGSDSSKEESRSNTPEKCQRRNQYVRQPQQRRQEPSYQYQSPPQAAAERRAPYSYTSEHLQTAVKQTSPNVLERPRAPYNYNSQQLQHESKQSPNLYPNLNAQEEGYVYVQRSPQPSAPPASEVQASPKSVTHPPASRSIPEPPELPKAAPRRPPPQISTVPKITPTTSLVSDISTVPKITPTTNPVSEIITVTKITPTTSLVSEISTVPKITPTTSLVSEISTVPKITPTTSLVSEISTMPKITPTMSLVSEISTVPKITPTMSLVSDISTVPKITPTTNPVSEISTVPKIPPTTRPLVSQIGTMPSVPPTLKSPAPILNSLPNIPTTSKTSAPISTMGLCTPPALKPLVSEIKTVSKITPLLNTPEIPATQSPKTCEAEVNILPLVSPRSPQSISSPAPGPSQPTNYSANNNNPRPAARNRGNTDSYSCPTCGQRLGLTIYQCLGGHSSCKDCRLAGRACGTCSSAITDMRNISLEAFMAELTSPCQSPGCTLSFKAYDMERHVKECPFGEIDCPMGTLFGQCSTRCKVTNLAAHFDACHREQRTAEIDKEMYVFNICMETHKLFLIKNGSFNFLVHLKVHEKERKISMFVQLLGTKISAAKWTYEFHVYNKRQPLRKYLYVDSCQSIGTPVDEIFNESQCATLPLTYAMTFVNESALTYKFFIKKEMNQRVRRPRNK